MSAWRIACHGRQKSKWYLSFQQLIAASAPLRFIIARRRALSARSSALAGSSARFRATPFHNKAGPPALCQNTALWVSSGVRAEAVTTPSPPSAFTSLSSAAYAALSSSSGPSLRNCDELCSRNGFTPPTHGVGSSGDVPFGNSRLPVPRIRVRLPLRRPEASVVLSCGDHRVGSSGPRRDPLRLELRVRYRRERRVVVRGERFQQGRSVIERDAGGHCGNDVGENAIRRGRGSGLLRGSSVGPRGLEPRTCGLRVRCSARLS